MIKLGFYGASRTVTGSCFLLQTSKSRVLIDCGMFQGSKAIKERNYEEFPFDVEGIEYVILTHAHIDHSGLIPKLIKKGFKGNIIATLPTVDFCSIMLPDSGYIQEMEVERKNKKNKRAGIPLIEPIYTSNDAHAAMTYFRGVDYDLKTSLTNDITIRFRNSGHIMGSAIVELWIEERGKQTKLVFSGDLGNFNQPIIKDPETITEADYLIVESTYGDRIRGVQNDTKGELERIIRETKERGGNLIIPSFAIERTQDLLYDLNLLKREGKLPDIDIFVDSPLAISATEIFCKNVQYFDERTKELYEEKGRCPLFIDNLIFTRTTEESKALNERKKPAIIISASGMCDAGRIKHHLKHNLWRNESTILFVGYQAEGTLGRKILDGAKKVRIHGEEIAVSAKIEKIEGYSGHADLNGLLNWVRKFDEQLLKAIFIVHGEANSMENFKMEMEKSIKNAKIEIPEYKEVYILKEEEIVEKTIEKKEEFSKGIVQDKFKDVLESLLDEYNSKLDEKKYKEIMEKLQAIDSVIKGK